LFLTLFQPWASPCYHQLNGYANTSLPIRRWKRELRPCSKHPGRAAQSLVAPVLLVTLLRHMVTLDEAIKELEESIRVWEARPADDARQQRVREARAQLARVQREAEREGQLTLGEEPAPEEWGAAGSQR
jgi:hypothetical protein